MIQIYNTDCVQGMRMLADEYVDLTVTSPPYDNLRTYKGFEWDFEATARELYRVTKQGGVVVWIVNDATINGSETGSSFKQALFFKEIGFNLHDTMIWDKGTLTFPETNRYYPCFEYMFVFSKGKPKTFNPIKIKCDSFGTPKSRTKSNKEEGSAVRNRDAYTVCKEYKIRKNIFEYSSAHQRLDHPAIFPEELAKDHILSWSNEGDVVLDPFLGSGTTGKMAIVNNRQFIGIELNEEFAEKAKTRIDRYANNGEKLF